MPVVDLKVKIDAEGKAEIVSATAALKDLDAQGKKTTKTFSELRDEASKDGWANLQRRFDSLKASAAALTTPIGAATAAIAAGAAIITGMVAAVTMLTAATAFAVTTTATYGSGIADVAAKTNIGTRAAQEYQLATKLVGVANETVARGMSKLQNEVVKGNAAFASLGLDVQRLKSMQPEQMFAEVAREIAAIQNPAEQTAAAIAIFGRSGAELLPVMTQNLKAAAAEAERLGLILSDEAVAAADDFDDATTKLGEAWTGVIHQFGAAALEGGGLTDVVNLLTDTLADLSHWVIDHKDDIGAFFEVGAQGAKNLIQWVKDAVRHFEKLKPLVDAYKGAVGNSSLLGSYLNAVDQQRAANAANNPYGITASASVTVGTRRFTPPAGPTDAEREAERQAKAYDEAMRRYQEKVNEDLGKLYHLPNMMGPLPETAVPLHASHAAMNRSFAFAPGTAGMEINLTKTFEGLGLSADQAAEAQARLAHEAAKVDFNKFMRGLDAASAALAGVRDFLARFGIDVGAFADLGQSGIDFLRAAKKDPNGKRDAAGMIGGGFSAAGSMFDAGVKHGPVVGALAGAGGGAAMGAQFGPVGALIGGGVGAITGALGGIFGNKAKETAALDAQAAELRGLRDEFIKTAGGIEQLRAKAREAGLTLDGLFSTTKPAEMRAEIARLTDAFDRQAKAQQLLEEATQRYGFTVEELGPKMQQQKLHEQAAQLYQDWQLLIASGIENETVLKRMAPAMNDYLQTSMRAGQAIPEQMRPALEEMLRLGLLTDETGAKMTSLEGVKWTKDLTESMREVVESVKDLVAALQGIPNVERTVTVRTVGVSQTWLQQGNPFPTSEPSTTEPITTVPGAEELPVAAAGGFIPHTPGGVPIRTADEEGEYQVPESKAPAFARAILGRSSSTSAAGGGDSISVTFAPVINAGSGDPNAIGRALAEQWENGFLPQMSQALRRRHPSVS